MQHRLRASQPVDVAVFAGVSAIYFLTLFGPKTLSGNIDLLAASCVLAAGIWWRLIPGVLDTTEFWLTALAACYILLVLALSGVADLWWALKPPRVLVNYVGVFVCVTYALRRFGPSRTLLMFHNAVFLHAALVLGMAFSPSFKELIASLFGGVTKSTFQISGLTRSLALTSIVMMFPFVTYPLFAILEGYRERWIGIKLLAMLSASFFMGRTGLYLCLACSSVIVASLAMSRRIAPKRVIATGLGVTTVASVVMSSVLAENSWLNGVPVGSHFAQPLGHMFEPLANYRVGRGLRAASLDHIQSMPIVYHNETPLDVLFGTGSYGRGDPWTYLPTDVAYLHMFSAFGVFGVALMMLAYVVSLPQHVAMSGRAAYWALAAVVLITLAANAKETALFTRHIYTVHVTFLAWLAHERWARSSHDEMVGR
jgi:hypothetical protein